MGKMMLIYVLFFVVVSTTLETKVMKKKASRLWSNVLIILSSLTIGSTVFIIITFITCTKKVLIIVVYKFQDLCTIYRQMPCITVKDKIFRHLITNICSSFKFFSNFYWTKCV